MLLVSYHWPQQHKTLTAITTQKENNITLPRHTQQKIKLNTVKAETKTAA